nr:hypothetical protein CFP56_14714 [Quercus suber]
MSCNYIRKVTVRHWGDSKLVRCSVVLRFLDTNCVNVAASDNSMQTKCNKHTACGWIWAHKDFEILEMVVDVKI